MSIAQVVTRGYGNGTYAGQVRQVVARGFFNSAVVPVQVEQLYNITVKANSGTYTFATAPYFTGETSFSAAGLATGITFNTTTGVITVNSATASGSHTVTVTATNAQGSTAANPIVIKVSTSKLGIDSRDYED
jgi:putative Ig domain-containing protein